MAERLTPEAVRITLIPTMPLHVAFWFGARLGYTHAREVVVHGIRQADGAPAYFPATSLRAIDSDVELLDVDRLEAIDDSDPDQVALAVDLQGRGDQFFDQVLASCRRHGFGYLLRIRTGSPLLTEDTATFTAGGGADLPRLAGGAADRRRPDRRARDLPQRAGRGRTRCPAGRAGTRPVDGVHLRRGQRLLRAVSPSP
ncbi:MAG TPA: SAVED domain-containing protein [Amycolatopsis sp.]|nr:SAVED domain-containing protein [Amycolatopsis sp.]